MTNGRNIYDSTPAYEAEIKPLIAKLLDLCDKHDVQLFGMTTFAIEIVPCHCGRPGCDGTGYGFKCDTFGVAQQGSTSGVQRAIMALSQLPTSVQRSFVDAIIAGAAVLDAGGQVHIEPMAMPAPEVENDMSTERFQAELRRMQSALRRRGGWH